MPRFAMFALGFALCATFAHAQATLFVEEPFGTFGKMNPTGHAAIYLAHVCAETPTRLRVCRPGEMGAVISRYHKIDGYDWMAMPLIAYLYAVETPAQVPAMATPEVAASLRDRYRRNHLEEFAPDEPGGGVPSGEWIQLVGASYDRKIYGFELDTTREQDERVIAYLNSHKNDSHFNLFFNNCADFSRKILNLYFQDSLHRNYIADTGFTTPKEIGKLMVSFSRKHRDLRFSAFVIPQVSGTIGRSTTTRGVLESLVKSKKYVLPLVVFDPWLAGGMGLAYLATGRFNPAHYAETVFDPRELPQDLLASSGHPAGKSAP